MFDLARAVGPRGFLGSLPEPTAETSSAALEQGVARYGQSIGVRRSIDEAREHDGQFEGLHKILYFVGDRDLADLTADPDPARVQARFAELLDSADLVYFDIDGSGAVHPIPREQARHVFDPARVSLIEDERGVRFLQNGWIMPQLRGVMLYDKVFDTSSSTLKRTLERVRALENKGYTITFNGDFGTALKKARDQVRLHPTANGGSMAMLTGSRYRDREVLKQMVDGYNADTCFSVEVRDPQGRMVAGALGSRGGNVYSLDTAFYDFTSRDDTTVFTSADLLAMPDATGAKSLINLAKNAFLAGQLRLHEHGIDVVDVLMVTPFTAGLKAQYIPGTEFQALVKELAARPPIAVDMDTPISFKKRS